MTGQAGARPQEPIREGKYARIERERRFLLVAPPPPPAVTARRRITDRYLPGTRLRLRRIDYPGSGNREFKFTQKVPANRPGYVQGLITNTYLSAAEYDLLATLPAAVLTKTRLSVPPVTARGGCQSRSMLSYTVMSAACWASVSRRSARIADMTRSVISAS